MHDPISFQFTPSGAPGINPLIIETLHSKGPLKCYKHFLSDDILHFIVDQTNLYAQTVIVAHKRRNNNELSYRLKQWIPLSLPVFKIFLGITIWTGLCKFPRMNDSGTGPKTLFLIIKCHDSCPETNMSSL